MHPHDHEYSGVMQKFKLSSLATIGTVNDSSMAYKLIVGEIDCDELCDKFVNRNFSYELHQFRHCLNPPLVPYLKQIVSLLCLDSLALGMTFLLP